MEKIATVPGRVDDIGGLYVELKKAGFDVLNVAADGLRTYVYLNPDEEKDPIAIMEGWVGKPAPGGKALERRVAEMEEAMAIQPRRLEKTGNPATVTGNEAVSEGGFVRRFWKLISG